MSKVENPLDYCDICKKCIPPGVHLVSIHMNFDLRTMCNECADDTIGLDKFLNTKSIFSKACFACEQTRASTPLGAVCLILYHRSIKKDIFKSFWIHEKCIEPSFMKMLSLFKTEKNYSF